MATKKRTATLSSGIKLTFGELNQRIAQEMILELMGTQLMDSAGNIITDSDVDNMSTATQIQFTQRIMNLVGDILLEPDVVSVTMPPDSEWLKKTTRRSYVRSALSEMGESPASVANDEDLKRFIYLRYVAIQDDDDFNVILNNTLLASVEVDEPNAPA